MERGDYVYFRDKNGDTCPSIVQSVKGKKVKIKNLYDREVWVNKSNCDLQSEWR